MISEFASDTPKGRDKNKKFMYLRATLTVNNMSIPALHRPRDPLSSSSSVPQSVHLSALTHGSPDKSRFWSRWFETEQKIRTYIQNKIQNKKKKRFRNEEDLIIPKSARLFLINLDDVLVLHPQLTWTHSRGETRFSDRNKNKILFFYYILLLQDRRDKRTSFGVWLSAILCPSNRNLSVLAGTPWNKHTHLKLWPQTAVTHDDYFTHFLVPVSGCKTPSASSDVSSF